jgi:hypothetical protein
MRRIYNVSFDVIHGLSLNRLYDNLFNSTATILASEKARCCQVKTSLIIQMYVYMDTRR